MERLEQLEAKMAETNFWEDIEKAQGVLKESKDLKNKIDDFQRLERELDDLFVLLELAMEEDEVAVSAELKNGIEKLRKDIYLLKIKSLLNQPYDRNNAILSLHAGAGGTEAQDWVEMLLRMYTRWAENKGYKVRVLDILPGEEAGIKNITLLIEGDYAYGYLKAEKGVHRLVRISPFDASGKRHTSFALVEVLPELEEDIEIDIDPADLKIETFRSGGAGGQHVNKTESAVRITHIPTGIVVQCQNERSQHSNRDTAMKMLKAKLLELKEREMKEKIEDLKGEHKEIGWGNQIRSYVFNPYSLVKDHRTGVEVGNVQAVMDGDIDIFINEWLKLNKK